MVMNSVVGMIGWKWSWPLSRSCPGFPFSRWRYSGLKQGSFQVHVTHVAVELTQSFCSTKW